MASLSGHTFGHSCRLAPVSPPQPHGALEGIPPLNAHFFYSSPIPLDDPLSTATTVGATDSKYHKAALRPFSPGDSNTLEKAWLGLSSDSCRKNHARAQRDRSLSPSLSKENATKLDAIIQKLVVKHRTKHECEGQGAVAVTNIPEALPNSPVPVCCSELLIDASAELRNEFCALVRRRQQLLDHDRVVETVMSRLGRLRSGAAETAVAATEGHQSAPESSSKVYVPDAYIQRRNDRSLAAQAVPGVNSPVGALPSIDIAKVVQTRPSVHDDGISGLPFLRVGTGNTPEVSPTGSPPNSSSTATDRPLPDTADNVHSQRPQINKREAAAYRRSRDTPMVEESTDIPVGVSRLHKVSLPVLQMKPIYWSPVNDISIVVRSTWFYK